MFLQEETCSTWDGICSDSELASVTLPSLSSCSDTCFACFSQTPAGEKVSSGCANVDNAIKDHGGYTVQWAAQNSGQYQSQVLSVTGVGSSTDYEKAKKLIITFASSSCKNIGTSTCPKYCCKTDKRRKCMHRSGYEKISEPAKFNDVDCTSDALFIGASASL